MTTTDQLDSTNVLHALQKLANSASKNNEGFVLPDSSAVQDLTNYLGLLLKWNKVMNLVGPYSWQEILDILLVDSFYLASFLNTLPIGDDVQTWDLGAGAGLPGIPLRSVWKKGSYTLVDAREKRTLFLRTVLAACTMPNTFVFQGRAELFMQNKPPADLIVSRAFLPWEQVLALVEKHVKPMGFAVFLTLTTAPTELPIGWALAKETSYTTIQGQRFLWAIQKN